MSSYFEQRMAEVAADASLINDRKLRGSAVQAAPQVGYVYFVRMGRRVKIGYTLDVAARMKAIQTSCPDRIHILRIERGTVDDERAFHRRFRRYNTSGEWFALEGWLATFLRGCADPVEIPPPIARKNFFEALLGSDE